MSTLTVKAFWEKSCKETEIRRFPIDPSVSSSFAYLTSRLPQIFGGLQGKTFSVHWKDSDKDLVACSSDEELMDALGFVNDGVFRIYIRETGRASGSEHAHPGVVCDVCNQDIRGSRFKCLECPDYDLCGVCENNGEHSHHRMLRLRDPNMPVFPGWPGMFGGGPMAGMFAGAGMPPGPPPPPYGPPPHHPPGPGPFGGGGGGRQGWPFRKMMKRCWRNWMRNNWWQQQQEQQQAGGACGNTNGGAAESEEDVKRKEARKEKSAPAGESCAREQERYQREQAKSDQATGGQEADDDVGDEYLRNVGESVAAMLDPLGIDVDVSVDQHGSRKRCHGGWNRGRGGGGGWGRGWGPGPSGAWNPFAMFGMRPGENPWQPPHAFASGSQSSEASTTASGPTASAECAASSADINMQSPPHQSESGDWTVLDKDGNRAPDKMDDKPASPQSSAAASAPPPPAAAPQPAAAVSKERDIATPAHTESPPKPVQHHPDPKINEALTQLLTMGFTNDGGWLTSLLVSKDGDINKVLDALRPSKSA